MEAIRCHSSAERKLWFLYSMNVIDWICTVVLLRNRGFIEANPIAAAFIGDMSAGFLIKCAIPLALIGIILKLCADSSVNLPRGVDRWLSFGIALYLFIITDHIVNFVILFLGVGT